MTNTQCSIKVLLQFISTALRCAILPPLSCIPAICDPHIAGMIDQVSGLKQKKIVDLDLFVDLFVPCNFVDLLIFTLQITSLAKSEFILRTNIRTSSA